MENKKGLFKIRIENFEVKTDFGINVSFDIVVAVGIWFISLNKTFHVSFNVGGNDPKSTAAKTFKISDRV